MSKSNFLPTVKSTFNKYFKIFLMASGLLALGVVLFYIIAVSRGYYHMDCTDTILWAQAMLDGKTIINPEFNYAGVIPFGGQLIMLPFVAIFGYGMKAQIMGMVLFALLFTAALVYFLKSINMSWRWVSVTTAAVLLFTCSSEKMREIFWCHIIYYSLGLLFLFVGLGLVFNMLKQDKISVKYYIILFIWTMLCSTNVSSSLTLYTAPVIGAVIAERFLDTDTPFWSKKNSKHGIIILVIGAAVIAGYILSKLIIGSVTAGHQNVYSTFEGMGTWVSNFLNILPGILSLCGVGVTFESIFSLEGIVILLRIVIILVVIITPIVMLFRINRYEEREYKIMILVHGIVLVLQIMGWVVGRLNDCNWRLSPLVISSVILCVMEIRRLYKKGSSFRFSMVLIIPMAIGMMFFASEVHTDFCKGKTLKNERLESIADFLESEDLDFGYATFWHSNIITLLTESEIMIAPIDQHYGNIFILEYQSNDNWYTDNERDEYFILLTSEEYKAYMASTYYIEPDEVLTHEKYYVLLYDYNVIQELNTKYEAEYGDSAEYVK